MSAALLIAGSPNPAEKISRRSSGVLPVHGEVKSLRPLTVRQRQALTFIADHIAAHGVAPTHREIGRHMGIRSTNGVNDHLLSLERKGCILKRSQWARAMRVTIEGYAALDEEEE